jgi:hypothetical protein
MGFCSLPPNSGDVDRMCHTTGTSIMVALPVCSTAEISSGVVLKWCTIKMMTFKRSHTDMG